MTKDNLILAMPLKDLRLFTGHDTAEKAMPFFEDFVGKPVTSEATDEQPRLTRICLHCILI